MELRRRGGNVNKEGGETISNKSPCRGISLQSCVVGSSWRPQESLVDLRCVQFMEFLFSISEFYKR